MLFTEATACLIANLPVLRSGFPPIVVPTEARQEYKRSISDYQATIPELEGLETLSDLPDNLERDRFRGLCRGYWEPTQALLREAMEMQEKKCQTIRRARVRRGPRHE